ncbi:MAG: bifunctional nuclease family protein [candidate division WOR-3 bacterium]|nr:bifunctional nuclease family protein [candidate division WOR-3 bacterium]MCX7757459.1 bifunctional nuclease family protein [candidate division WOR-3 bacterium]MDW7987900.1 bifunctional nuclease family protein [candidate division WOR-3 bacterium]
MIEVKVAGVLFNEQATAPVMILKELNGSRALPIFIGPAEATAILYALENIKLKRPLTIDLLKNLLDAFAIKVQHIIITALKQETFYAEIIMEHNGKIFTIDARPSDSVGLAVRCGSPIFVAEDVLNQAGIEMTPDDEARLEELRSSIRKIPPEEFGTYKL